MFSQYSHTFLRKCPENPDLTCFAESNSAKMRKINRPWPNPISCEDDKDTSACQISGHYFRRSFENAHNPQFGLFHIVLGCVTLKLNRWPWKRDLLFHWIQLMFSVNLMKFEWKSWEILPKSVTDRQADGDDARLDKQTKAFIELFAAAKHGKT